MRRIVRSSQFPRVRKRLLHRQGTAPDAVAERLAVHELHHQEEAPLVLADVVQRADVRVGEPGQRARLAGERILSRASLWQHLAAPPD